MQNHDIVVDILVNGRPIRKYAHENRVFIESRENTVYSIRIKNNGFYRRLVVVSVDGINVINGEPAGSSKAGYVINGYSSIDVAGFRTSLTDVHPFKFNLKKKSYAAKSPSTGGDTSNCGAIGIEVYSESLSNTILRSASLYTPETTPMYDITCDSRTYACDVDSSLGGEGAVTCSSCWSSSNTASSLDKPRSFDMGTEFSKQAIKDAAFETRFEIGMLVETISIYYASFTSLLSMGVPVSNRAQAYLPNPFPSRFCKPPST